LKLSRNDLRIKNRRSEITINTDKNEVITIKNKKHLSKEEVSKLLGVDPYERTRVPTKEEMNLFRQELDELKKRENKIDKDITAEDIKMIQQKLNLEDVVIKLEKDI